MEECPECYGTGWYGLEAKCDLCHGSGHITKEQLAEWNDVDVEVYEAQRRYMRDQTGD